MSDVKRIALFLDGTWNNVDDNTNVYRAKSLCNKSPEQLCYYSAGVGTQAGDHIAGGMFGIGINQEVLSAYEWLVDHYEPDARIFIFGFSRGAFTARSLAGFISICGLLKPGSPISLKQLYERYRKGKAEHSIRALAHIDDNDLSQEDKWLKRYSRPIPVWFQGVWDTVGALGVPLPWAPHISSEDFAFLETDLRINDTYAYHAMAIDEHREAFKPTLWQKQTPKQGDTYKPRDLADVEQRWFVGAHANVGGGYENDLLAQVPLQWLMNKAASHGLIFNSEVTLDGDEAGCPIRDSYAEMAHGLYEVVTLGKHYYRPIGTAPIDNGTSITTVINETIDASVFERWRKDSGYRPKNLADWGARHDVDPGQLSGNVSAADPALSVP
ncbi:hypothetical protein ALQ04_02895 [Pseudomonas cichorii]|uniref:T6SS Phospholipase effector Tle1-like catalytic domain-containing protein n=1 Tax=Pseudomonas cichorii TaxID=36746 RepID=A0A3M4M9E2_PSECI|nr:DUF2235 domain-containing protein [Pseudomonas cichorii]RMQ50442.1 hypothetical protein ALQ04_02895 [Pseudomonas cichorii]